jgi:hypothetical protein
MDTKLVSGEAKPTQSFDQFVLGHDPGTAA